MKERMKRMTALLLCLLMAFSLAACGNNGNSGNGTNEDPGANTTVANTPRDSTGDDSAASAFVVADTDEGACEEKSVNRILL